MTHSPGAVRAAEKITAEMKQPKVLVDWLLNIIYEETHLPELIAFIEKVAAWDFDIDFINGSIEQAQNEAFALIKKVRG